MYQQHNHALIAKRCNKDVWESNKPILSNTTSRHYTLMNARTPNGLPQGNTIPPWLLPCTCGGQRYHFQIQHTWCKILYVEFVIQKHVS